MRLFLFSILFIVSGCVSDNQNSNFDINIRVADAPPIESEVESVLMDVPDLADIKYVFFHTMGSRDGHCWTEEDLNVNWKNRKFSRPGYHIVVNPKQECGVIYQGEWSNCGINRSQMRWGVSGYDDEGDRFNRVSLHISWVGGYEGTDTRTDYQKKTIHLISNIIKFSCPNVKFVGHNEFANKSCPNFNVSKEFNYLNQ